MVKVLFRLIIMAAPVICFWWLLQNVVIRLFHTGDVYLALGYVLGGVLLLGIWETLAVRVWVLPFFGRVFIPWGYSSSPVMPSPQRAVSFTRTMAP